MSGLSSRIPGLAMHRTEAPARVEESPEAVIERLLRDALDTVGKEHPSGALAWLREHRADVAAFLRKAEAEVDAAAELKDVDRLRKALQPYLEGYRRAFALFNARPTHVQGGLFK